MTTEMIRISDLAIDVDWGGEQVYLRTVGSATRVDLDLTDSAAEGMLAQLVWAVSEVRRFRAHMAAGGDAMGFDCEPKPSQGGIAGILADKLEQLAAQYPETEFPETGDEIVRCAAAGITLDGIQALAIRERLLTEAKRLRGEQS